MHVDPLIPPLVGVVAVVLALGLILQTFRQPQLVGYIVAGIIIGPSGLGLLTDVELIEHLGAIGVTLLLFFVGMEVSPFQLIHGWRVAVLGTLSQILVSVASVALIGVILEWSPARIILLGFVISLSSTAVVLKLLKDRGELNSKAGNNVLLILLAQDLAVVPMLIAVSFLSGEAPGTGDLLKQVIGGAVMVTLAVITVTREQIRLPLAGRIRKNHELQVFAALLICFGLAFVTGSLGLSSALGAFVAGMIVASARETDWVRHSLEPLRIIFIGLLFVSMGMLIDLSFIAKYWEQVILLVAGVLLTNTFINAFILKALGDSWRTSLYSAALLAQIGEFSFVLASVGLQAGIIEEFSYQMTIAVIALTLLLSPAWIAAAKALVKVEPAAEET
jgi:CPA2 family monovalent cation:H+ antiporter-2